MPYSITTKDGITINNIPDDLPPDDQSLKDRVAQLRGGQPAPQQGYTDPRKQLVADIGGGLEGAATMLTGLGSSALGGIAGGVTALNPFAEQGEGARVSQSIQEAGTYQPRTQEGQQAIGNVAELLAPVEEFKEKLGEETLAATGSPLLATGAHMLPEATLSVLGLKSGMPKTAKLPKITETAAPFVRNKPALKALGGDIESAKTVSLIEQMNPSTKGQVAKMLNIVNKGRKQATSSRPSDIVGESVANRARAIADINKKSSKVIGSIARKMGKAPVDITAAKTNFFKSLNDLGVSFKQGKDGWVTPDFSRSKFAGGSQKDMAVLINDL